MLDLYMRLLVVKLITVLVLHTSVEDTKTENFTWKRKLWKLLCKQINMFLMYML